MPYFLRRRFVCFYCGHKSSQTKDASVRQWRCANCDAVNYLDENGEITDPPAVSTPEQPVKYTTATSLQPQSSKNNVFCQTCQKNQHFYLEALNNYLPDPSDANYHKFEASLPQYKRDLEKRFPLVCANCVGAANDQLQDASRFAQREDLRLRLLRTKRGEYQVPLDGGWRHVLIFIGASCWWTSITVQLIWDVLGVVLSQERIPYLAGSYCLSRSMKALTTDIWCFNAWSLVVKWSFYMSLATIWYNNRLLDCLRTRGRLRNLNDYYMVQVLLLAARVFVFRVSTPTSKPLSVAQIHALHAFMLVFTVVCTISSLFIVKVKEPAILSNYKAQLLEIPKDETQAPLTLQDRGDITLTPSKPQTAFPLAKLGYTPASTTPRQGSVSSVTNFSTSYAPTESTITNYDEGSEMDWTPTAPQITPRHLPSHRVAQPPVQHSPSPFRGKLPPNPIHPFHKALKPKYEPHFMRAPEEKRSDFQNEMMQFGKSGPLDLGGSGTGSIAHHEMSFAPPKLRTMQKETGLESIFNDIFSLSEGPQFSKEAAPEDNSQPLRSVSPTAEENPSNTPTRGRYSASLIILAITIPLWLISAFLFYYDISTFDFFKQYFENVRYDTSSTSPTRIEL